MIKSFYVFEGVQVRSWLKDFWVDLYSLDLDLISCVACFNFDQVVLMFD